MPRRLRWTLGDHAYHVLNRAVRRDIVFHTTEDYLLFENTLREALGRLPVRLLSYCVMPNHWHFVVWPSTQPQLSEFMQWLTLTHTRRWHVLHGTAGTGPIYQGRFKCVAIEDDDHLLRVCRYVERNPVRANLVARAEDWRWSSLWHRCRNSSILPLDTMLNLQGEKWLEWVNQPQTEAEVEAARQAIQRGRP